MEELNALRERMREQRPVAYRAMPDFPLYMDQVLSYMERQVLRFDEGDVLTSAMVNNYTKNGLLPRAEGKKYTREHLAYLTAICVLKHVMSAKDMEVLFSHCLRREEVDGDYAAFRESLDRSMNLVSDVMEGYPEEEDAAEAALHFALLSYAAGLSRSRFVARLRETQEGDAVEETGRKTRRKKTAVTNKEDT